MNWKTTVARRPVLAGILGLLGVGAAGGLVYEAKHLFFRRYPRTAYDDILDQLEDRESAAKLGQSVWLELDKAPAGARLTPAQMAAALRHGPGKGSLQRASGADAATGRIVEVHGWLIPTSVAMAGAIAAKVP
jgi:hypothetical protein